MERMNFVSRGVVGASVLVPDGSGGSAGSAAPLVPCLVLLTSVRERRFMEKADGSIFGIKAQLFGGSFCS